MAWRAARRLRTSPALYGIARRAYTAAGRVLPPRRIAGVPGPVHRNDLMVDPASEHSRTTYVERGQQVVALLDEALAGAGRTLAEADVLDFGCGHGRIVRHLAIAARSVGACDLDHEGVRFCVSAFGAVAVPGSTDLAEVALGRYDAIWLGSVITHHPPGTCAALLTSLADHLRPGGVLVVSSADHVTLQVDLDAAGRGWMQDEAARLRRELGTDGATYVAYPQVADGSYGLGYQTDTWLDAAVSGRGLTPLWHRSDDWGPQATHAWIRTDRSAGTRT